MTPRVPPSDGVTDLPGEEPVPVSSPARVVELLADALGGVVAPSLVHLLPRPLVLGQEAELHLEVLLDRDAEVYGAAALALLEGLEVVLVSLAAAEVEGLAGALLGVEVVPWIVT